MADEMADAIHNRLQQWEIMIVAESGGMDSPDGSLAADLAAAVRAHLRSEAVVERVARDLIRRGGAEVVASDEHWPETVAHYRRRVAADPSYARAYSLITDAFRNAQQAIDAAVGGGGG